MSTPNLKFLYETTVNKQVEEKVIEYKEENGEKIEISRTVKKIKPVKIAILEPRRKLLENGELFYAKQTSYFIQNGLLPRSLVVKRYLNDGGPLSEPEKQRVDVLEKELEELQKELFSIAPTVEEQDEKRRDLSIKVIKTQTEINQIKNSFNDIFENTVETKARNKTVEWWVFQLAYIDEDETGYKPIFGDGNYESKVAEYDRIEELNVPHIIEAIKKISYFVAVWFNSQNKITQSEFKEMDDLYNDSISDYKLEEDKVDIKVTDKTLEK